MPESFRLNPGLDKREVLIEELLEHLLVARSRMGKKRSDHTD
ncbi:MAG: hypothetical protein WBM86_23735 [Waterburya sp.]